ncbi:unnamed protein product [Moneuplotes crassus]|uniref:Uncharacterized protein n=1 Tax=Euplotes crassus TaxID=5936 RepID=A0AAD1XPJ1_EUPCR|nr:unnamed protein product [Moneuplotes crassus]
MSVGKTSLINRYANSEFKEIMQSTTGICNVETIRSIDGSQLGSSKPVTILAKLWDTVGQEKFDSIPKRYYKGVDGILLVYDITDSTTFDKINYWMKQIAQNVSSIPIIMVGNKTDIESLRAMEYQEGKNKATELGLEFYEVSAKSGEGVNEAFDQLIIRALQNSPQKLNPKAKKNSRKNKVVLKSKKKKNEKKAKCKC